VRRIAVAAAAAPTSFSTTGMTVTAFARQQRVARGVRHQQQQREQDRARQQDARLEIELRARNAASRLARLVSPLRVNVRRSARVAGALWLAWHVAVSNA
jgi:hypothetical protein